MKKLKLKKIKLLQKANNSENGPRERKLNLIK